MFIELLTIENDLVTPGIDVYTIPVLKEVLDNYEKEDALEIYTYLHYLYHPKSAYKNRPEDEREDIILEDIRKGEWDENEPLILEAKKWVEKAYITPTKRFYLDSKVALERLGEYMRSAQIKDGKDGNFGTFSQNMMRIGKMIEEFKKLEKILVDEEGGPQTRGDQVITPV